VLRGERKILSDVNLTIKRGENVAIIGPNGSGKSTFIKLINIIFTAR
jgi:ABC-type cobalamin/Fe3+-siderophores transport system ATPase subunit